MNNKLRPLQVRLGQFDLAQAIEEHKKVGRRQLADKRFINGILKTSNWEKNRFNDQRKYGNKWLDYCRFTDDDSKTVFERGLLCFTPLRQYKALDVSTWDYLSYKSSKEWEMFVSLLGSVPRVDVLCIAGEAFLQAKENKEHVEFNWEKEAGGVMENCWLTEDDDRVESWLEVYQSESEQEGNEDGEEESESEIVAIS
ncbi:hypothetical protein J7337_013843 [Fusarium musae]|uniref:Uncharacterized protein n=1 Tax=Fusarium musae TaxID=1042133 RepID=A0A9P8IFG3_9HYPO|nr:hypothetical protein J7337_013843 [Fusarium musae]KAG9494704.1 hypothetical protein J7337_013843 [Fusarium musae]